MRSVAEQMEGLHAVATAAAKLHRINLILLPSQSDVCALTGAEHGRDVEIVYAVDGYDVWINDPDSSTGQSIADTDLSLDEAATVIADAYMHDKAATVLDRDFGWVTGAIEEFLENDHHREWFFAELDKGSDSVRDGSPERRREGLRQAVEVMTKQTGASAAIVVLPDA